jgi:hypothetical protein
MVGVLILHFQDIHACLKKLKPPLQPNCNKEISETV